MSAMNAIRWGLCCLFQAEPIHFGVRQATHLSKHDRSRQLAMLSATVLANGQALLAAIDYCADSGIGAFRVNSRIFPLKTHPQIGYEVADLPDHAAIARTYRQAADQALRRNIRLSFHPDQFTLLSSPDAGVTARSLAELAYHAEAAAIIGADVLTLHGGGAYGDKPAALARLTETILRLPAPVRSRLALENDDRTYTPADLLPICAATGVAKTQLKTHMSDLSTDITGTPLVRASSGVTDLRFKSANLRELNPLRILLEVINRGSLLSSKSQLT